MSRGHEGDLDSEFLVAYDYGMGGLWAILLAPSPEAIREKYPELSVVADRPVWLSEDELETLRGNPLWLDDPPTGILNAVIADRSNS